MDARYLSTRLCDRLCCQLKSRSLSSGRACNAGDGNPHVGVRLSQSQLRALLHSAVFSRTDRRSGNVYDVDQRYRTRLRSVVGLSLR